ncbi:MAG: hypothetical protein K2W95_17285 [Candidatus Obscuribacterales bacterium]|nr:hypothetical protein [Candidatus Obscuribacterales bacterium]
MKPSTLILVLLAAAAPAPVSGSPAKSSSVGDNRVAQTAAIKSTSSSVHGAVTASSSATTAGGSQKNAKAPAAIPTKIVDGFELLEHSSFRGALKATICPEGICLRSRDLDAVMQPSSHIGYLVHRGNKRYLEMDPSKGIQGLGHFSYFPGPEKVVKVGTENLDLRPKDARGNPIPLNAAAKAAGKLEFLPTTHYYIEKYRLNRRTGKADAVPYWMTDLWVCDSLGISKTFAGRCARLCMLPAEYGMPVKVVRLYDARRRAIPLTPELKKYYEKTRGYGLCMSNPQFAGDERRDLKILLDVRGARKVKVNVTDTQLPKGFTRVKTEMDLLMSEQDSALLKELD